MVLRRGCIGKVNEIKNLLERDGFTKPSVKGIKSFSKGENKKRNVDKLG